MDYKEYLASERWQLVREAAFKRDGYACRECGSNKELNVHHVVYPNEFQYDCVDNVIVLCRAHHAAWHKKGPTPKQTFIHVSEVMPPILDRLMNEAITYE